MSRGEDNAKFQKKWQRFVRSLLPLGKYWDIKLMIWGIAILVLLLIAIAFLFWMI